MNWATAITLIIVTGLTLSGSSIVSAYAQNQSSTITNESAINGTEVFNATSIDDAQTGEISAARVVRIP